MVAFVKEISKGSVAPPLESQLELLARQYDFPIRLNESKRARRITLRVCHITGEIRITIPLNLTAVFVKAFIDNNLYWIKSQRMNISPQVVISEGSVVPLFGLNRTIGIDPGCNAKYTLTDTTLAVPKKELVFKHQIKKILIGLATDFFDENCNKYSEKLGVSFSKICLRDPKSRWGSCSSNRRLMFSWRLIMAPEEVSSYVIAHEVAHLVHMNHSKNFWGVVRSLYPDYVNQRNWLRRNGKNLHKFIF